MRPSSRLRISGWWGICSRFCRSWKRLSADIGIRAKNTDGYFLQEQSNEELPFSHMVTARMQRNNPDVSVVSPVYGCKACLEDLVDRVSTTLAAKMMSFEIILVDDGSPDDSWKRIVELATTRPWLKGLQLSRNFGQHYALAAGIEHAQGNVMIVMDCDLQDIPEEIPTLIDALGNGVDIAFAQRTDRQDGVFKRLGSWAFFQMLSWLTGVAQDHSTANFGAYSRKVIDIINKMPESDRCFPLMVKWTGLPSRMIPVRHAERSAGKSGYSLMKLARLGLNIILSYSDKPLRLVVKLGMLFSTFSLAIVILSIYRYSMGDIAVAGFTSIIASMWLLGGIITFCIGISGLYVGRLFGDIKQRPHYIINSKVNSTEHSD